MNAYALSDPATGAWLLLVLAASFVAGFVLTRGTGRWRGPASWCVPVAGFVTAERLTANEPAGVRMIAICLALLMGMKVVVGTASRQNGEPPLSLVAWSVFSLGWFGMRPAVYEPFPGPARSGVADLLVKAAQALAMGLGCVAAAMVLGTRDTTSWAIAAFIAAAPLMIGLSLLVHFALFDLLAALWRWFGANTRKLFRRPIVSRSLTEFWGRRWNLAFSEMTAIAVFRPLKPVAGVGTARVIAFLFSGLLHELAISVPVRAGYGGPFAYFVLHAIAMRIESGPLGRWLEASTWAGRAWTYTWLLLPLPMLFHMPFVRGVVLPIIGAE